MPTLWKLSVGSQPLCRASVVQLECLYRGQGVSLHVILKLHYGSALMYGVPLHSYQSGDVSILHI